MKVKSILEEDIIEKIDKTIVESFYGYETKETKKKVKKRRSRSCKTPA